MQLLPAEVTALMTMYQEHPAYHNHREWLAVICDRIAVHAQRHCGLIRIILQNTLYHYEIVEKRVPSPAEVMTWYHSRAFLTADLFRRFFNVDTFPADLPIRDVLRDVLLGVEVSVPPPLPSLSLAAATSVSGSVAMDHTADEKSQRVEAARWLIRHLVVYEHYSGVLAFASWFHRWFYASLIFPGRAADITYATVEQLICTVLGTFSRQALVDRCNWGTGMVKEGPLQHMFWAGALLSLPASTRVIAEVSNPIAADQKEASSGTSVNCFACLSIDTRVCNMLC